MEELGNGAQPADVTRRTRFWAWLKRRAPDFGWFGLSVAVGLASVAVGLFWKDGRQAGVPAIFFVLGFAIALSRFVLRRFQIAMAALEQRFAEARLLTVARFEELAEAVDETHDALARDLELSPIAHKLWQKERAQHREQFAAIRAGHLYVSGDDAADYLAQLTGEALKTLHAVDHIDVPRWFKDPELHSYLQAQLARVKEGQVSLERVRVVNDDRLGDDGYRDALIRFVELHDAVDASVLLCRESDLSRLKTFFFPSMGMLLVDREDHPTCLTGSVGKDGAVDRGVLYLKRGGAVETAIRDYKTIRSRIERERWDQTLRDDLGLLK